MTRSLLIAIGRTLALIVGTFGLGLWLGLLNALPHGAHGAHGGRQSAQRRGEIYAQKWARRTQKLIGMRLLVEGEVPRGPVALVMNHLSYMDIVALWCVMPGVFVARADVQGWPLIGRVGKLAGTIFIDRTRKRDLLRVIPEMEDVLLSGRNVIFFPEGTSSRGEKVMEFKSSLFEAAARNDVPVVCASLQFETFAPEKSADWSICWWGDMPFASHAFAVLKMSGFVARIRFSSPSHLNTNRKALSRMAQESVEKNFLPTTPPGDSVARHVNLEEQKEDEFDGRG